MQQARKLRVVVVDDSEVVRMKLRGLLEADAAFDLVGEAPDAESGLNVVREQQPDLVVMDLRMPGMSGIEATWQLGTIAPGCRVLVLTVSAEQEDVTDAIMAGARGYVVKGAQDAEITAALRGVAAGERVISPQVAGKLVERVRGDQGESRITTPSRAAPAAPRVRAPDLPATPPAARQAPAGQPSVAPAGAPVGTRPSVPQTTAPAQLSPADLLQPPLVFRTLGIALIAGILIALIASGDAGGLLVGALSFLVTFIAVNLGVLVGGAGD